MVKWHKIYTYSERVEQWDNQTIIEMPSESEYEGYFFLLPKKMVFSLTPQYSYFYFPDTWNFFLKNIQKRKKLSVSKMILCFKKESDEIMQFSTQKK